VKALVIALPELAPGGVGRRSRGWSDSACCCTSSHPRADRAPDPPVAIVASPRRMLAGVLGLMFVVGTLLGLVLVLTVGPFGIRGQLEASWP
jgi:hypothetical protein